MIKNIVLLILSISGGVVVGNAAAAFITLLGIIPRLAQISDTDEHIVLYQRVLTLGMFLFSLIFCLNISFKLNKYMSIFFGVFFGIFVGLSASALAEVLNVIPVVARKLDLRDYVTYLILAIVMGKVVGSLAHWLIIIK
ncbi:MAG: Stage V sporulation protein AB [Sporanaerobacter sp.]|jgi:stage V sporulation protein AB|uniref:stage V sporulation protein AB n=1 Tax=Sporanaerobacter sp. TaxID=2010183 RepID=UPI003A0FE7D3